MRARNFKPLASYQEDREALGKFGTDRFIGIYLHSARLDADNQRRFLATVSHIHPMFRWFGNVPALVEQTASHQ
jgi:hypothetical protein